jgi:hypothetical protein
MLRMYEFHSREMGDCIKWRRGKKKKSTTIIQPSLDQSREATREDDKRSTTNYNKRPAGEKEKVWQVGEALGF